MQRSATWDGGGGERPKQTKESAQGPRLAALRSFP